MPEETGEHADAAERNHPTLCRRGSLGAAGGSLIAAYDLSLPSSLAAEAARHGKHRFQPPHLNLPK